MAAVSGHAVSGHEERGCVPGNRCGAQCRRLLEVNREAKTIQENWKLRIGSSEGFALWGWERIYGEQGSMGIADQYDKTTTLQEIRRRSDADNGGAQDDARKMQNEVFVKIILGESIDTFDRFVEDWKKLGGDQITQEVNEWYEQAKR